MSHSFIENDRRDAVRVTGRSLFAYKVVDQQTYDNVKSDFEAGISLYTQEHLLDMQVFIGVQKALANIRDRDEDLADFLQHMDMKINLLLKKATDGKTPLDRLKLRDVNISSSGLAFITKEPLPEETILEIQMAFLPSYSFIYGFASVTSCETLDKVKDKQFYRVSARFTLIMDEDREMLIKQNFKQQGLALRNRKKRHDS